VIPPVPDFGSLRLGFAFTLGVFTFFAPCAFPLLPGYVAYFLGIEEAGGPAPKGGGNPARNSAAGRRRARVLRAVGVGLLTSLGFVLVYAVLAGVALSLGTRVLADVSVLELVVGILLVGLGTVMATGRIDLSLGHLPLPARRRSPAGYLGFGIIYASAAAGCTAPFFVAVASLGLAAGPTGAVAVLGAYALGMSVLMVGVTVAIALGRDALLGRIRANAGQLSRVAGVVLVVAGLVQLYYFLFVFDGVLVLEGLFGFYGAAGGLGIGF
jgi:cytochrome c-type biogenesis protein